MRGFEQFAWQWLGFGMMNCFIGLVLVTIAHFTRGQ